MVFVHHLVDQLEGDFVFVLLAPFDDFRLEVHLLAGHFVQVDVFFQYLLFDELLAPAVALVHVDGADEGFEGIAVHVAVVRSRADVVLHQLVQADFHGQFVQRLALHDFRAGVGQESFALPFETLEEDVGHDGVQDGVAQELQAFIVQRAAALGAYEGGFVQHGLLVVLYAARKKAQDAVKTKIRLSVLAEQEPYFVY